MVTGVGFAMPVDHREEIGKPMFNFNSVEVTVISLVHDRGKKNKGKQTGIDVPLQ